MDNPGDKDFEISLRILGNEFIGLKITVNDMKQKWVIAGLIAIAVLGFTVGEFGPAIVDMFNDV